MEGAWVERPGQSRGFKGLKERANLIVRPDALTGETFRPSSRCRRPKDEGYPHFLAYSILNSSSHIKEKKNIHQEPKTITSIGVFKIRHKTATPPCSTWVASYPSCHRHRGTYPSSYPPTPGGKSHSYTWSSCKDCIPPPIDLDSDLFLSLDLGLD